MGKIIMEQGNGDSYRKIEVNDSGSPDLERLIENASILKRNFTGALLGGYGCGVTLIILTFILMTALIILVW